MPKLLLTWLAFIGLTLSAQAGQMSMMGAGKGTPGGAAPAYTGLCDTSVSGTACAHYWGMRAATAAKRGPSNLVLRVCDVTTCLVSADFGTDATTGKIDVAAILASPPCIVACQVSILFDQIGTDNFTNVTTGSIAPTFNSSAGPSAGFSAAVFVAANLQFLSQNTATTINQPNLSIAATFKHTSSAVAVQIIFGSATSGGFFFPEYENPNAVELNAGTTALPVTSSDNAYHTVLAVAGAGGTTGHGWISVDAGTPATSTTIGSDNLIFGPAYIGTYNQTLFNADVAFEELAIWTSDVSANVSAINSNAHTFWGY